MVGRRDFLKRGGAGAAASLALSSGIVSPEELERRANRHDHEDDAPRHIVMLLVDRSGSMGIVRNETIEGLNKFLNEQRDKPDMLVSLVQFDEVRDGDLSHTETFDFTPAPQTPTITEADYVPRGGTPLYRAIVSAIARMEQIARPQDKVLLAVQTDGHDTDYGKHEITNESVKMLIKTKESEGNWTFAFLAAGLDVVQEAVATGVSGGNTFAYQNNATGTALAWTASSTSTNTWYRSKSLSTRSFYEPPNVTAPGSVTIEVDPTTAWQPTDPSS